jgi:two-component system NarL family response regulator
MGYFNVETQNALQYLKNDQVDLSQATMQRLVEISQGAYADLREFLLGMRQKFSETVDFYTSLEKYVHDFNLAYGQKVEVHLPPAGNRPELEPFAEVQLLRVIQESLSNIRKHAHASLATISFSNSPESIQVVIEDDGVGFDLAKIKSVEADENPHFGLNIMQERAEDIGGRLEFQSSPGHGTRVIVRLPTILTPRVETKISSLRVLVADDHPLFLDGLKNLLVARGVQVVATASNGQEAVQQALELQPDVAILDIQMPLVTGIEAARRIKNQAPNIRVLMLTMSADDNTLFEAIRAGASGYLLKDLNADEFLARLEGLMRGETPISPGLAERLLSEFSGGSQGESEHVQFNERQMEILTLMAQRYTYAQIAQRLYLSESTIKYHAAQIMERLHSKSKDEALVEAARRGLIERRKPGR